jgi:hypothetical protein
VLHVVLMQSACASDALQTFLTSISRINGFLPRHYLPRSTFDIGTLFIEVRICVDVYELANGKRHLDHFRPILGIFVLRFGKSNNPATTRYIFERKGQCYASRSN